jgi:hypothetical protein
MQAGFLVELFFLNNSLLQPEFCEILYQDFEKKSAQFLIFG